MLGGAVGYFTVSLWSIERQSMTWIPAPLQPRSTPSSSRKRCTAPRRGVFPSTRGKVASLQALPSLLCSHLSSLRSIPFNPIHARILVVIKLIFCLRMKIRYSRSIPELKQSLVHLVCSIGRSSHICRLRGHTSDQFTWENISKSMMGLHHSVVKEIASVAYPILLSTQDRPRTAGSPC